MGTTRISYTPGAAPTTHFYLEADVVETQGPGAGDGYGRWRIRCYLKCVNGGNSSSNFAGPGEHSGRVNATEFRSHEAGSNFLPSGYGTGATRWYEGPYDVWRNANSDGYWSGSDLTIPLVMIVDYGSVDETRNGEITLPRITQIPGVPTSVSGARVNDTQVNVSWTRNGFTATAIHVDQSVNGGAWTRVATLGNVGSAVVAAAANRKTIYRVRAVNSAGESDWSASSAAVYTTPAAPSSAVAVRDGLDVDLTWVNQAAYAEYETVIEHGVVDGGITWDGSTVVVPTGTTAWTDVAPDPGDVHVYRIHARPVSATSLTSAWAQSNSVQLLTAPDAPTLTDLPVRWTTDADLTVSWAHNSVDTSPQSAYELETSTNGGSSWSSTGKVTSGASSVLVAAASYSADDEVTFRVRTWGDATTGGSDSAGASPWSTPDTVTYKTRAVLTITSPADEAVIDESSLTVTLGFTQAESGTFVSAVVELLQASVVIETIPTTSTTVPLSTVLENGGNYQLQAVATDSWGLTSNTVLIDFAVDYAEPATPTLEGVYIPESGTVTLTVEDLVVDPAPVSVRLTRTIDGVTEIVGVVPFEGGTLTVIDTTPTIRGTNVYRAVTYSADGAASPAVEVEVVTEEGHRAFLSKAPDYSTFVWFGDNLTFTETPTVDQALVKTAGRDRPVGLYGTSGDLVVEVSSGLYEGFGSTPDQIRDFLSTPGRCCYRDPSGQRVFGQASGQIARKNSREASLSLTVTETSR